MKKIFQTLFCLLLLQQLSAQFRYDNKLYKTIFWEDFCQVLKQQNDYLLLDVRSPGEFADTSEYANLNIGHLKGAMNINIRQLPDSLAKLDAYKDKTIYVYCSHSQRSRRASKLLSEKGFTHVVNVNGGMTVLNFLENSGIPCRQSILETAVPYQLLTPRQICPLVEKNENIFLLDVRTDSAFMGITADEIRNAFGKFRQSVNIPFDRLANSLDKIPANKKIIIIDDFGNESAKAATLLFSKNYKDVSVLFNGLEEWASTDPSELPCKNQFIENKNRYALITPEEFSKIPLTEDMLVLDIRTDSEYNNLAKDYWRNIGKVNQSVNIPSAQLSGNISKIGQYKNKPIIVYGFSSSSDVFSSARLLTERGFSNVSVLMGGLFNIRWRAANLKDHGYLNNLVTNIPPDNY